MPGSNRALRAVIRWKANRTIVVETDRGLEVAGPLPRNPPYTSFLDLDLHQRVLLGRKLGRPRGEVRLAQHERDDVAGLLLAQ